MMDRTVKVSDCISRQIAIDLIKSWSGGYDYIETPTDAAVKSFEQLPSAEESFEWCYTCKEYDQEKHCCHRWTKVIRNTVEELQSAQPEITAEQVKEYCELRNLVVLTKEEYHWLKSLKSKAEEYRWNGGGNY